MSDCLSPKNKFPKTSIQSPGLCLVPPLKKCPCLFIKRSKIYLGPARGTAPAIGSARSHNKAI